MNQMKAADLFYTKKSVYDKLDDEMIDRAYDYSKGYMAFLDAAKTERESVTEGIKMAVAAGFVPYEWGQDVKPGDKYYYDNRGKNLFLFTVGTEDLNEGGFRISAAHVDSPRIDLKQCPVYEDNGIGYFKTHYYGGIRKYQWVTIPLALHGVVVKADGTSVDVVIGEDDNDPIFYITDILPHLAGASNSKPLGEAIPGEKLNLVAGTRPAKDADKDGVKLNILRALYEKYGIVEEDFLSAELSAVPTYRARDLGFDRALIAAYGHDDRVCAYPAITAIIDNKDSVHSQMCILADKEETGSDGPSGMQCSLMLDLMDAVCASLGANPAKVRSNSKCLSADVSAAYDPNFSDVFEKRNTPLLSSGVVLTKYTGSRGKSGTNDASAEFIGWLRGVMAKDNVVWQAGELGKVDAGGGGTVAKFISKNNIETVDLGVPVIAMHAPYEVISKVDLYEAYRAFCAFAKY